MSGNQLAMGVAYRDQLVKGTPTNDNAIAGDVGEYVSATVASGSAVALTTATPANITSISLTPGDWDIDGQVDFAPAASTSVTQYNASCSGTSATLATQPGGGNFASDSTFTINQAAMVPAATFAGATMTVRVTVPVGTTQTVYLVAQATFTVSTLSAYGTLRARRVR